MHRTLFLPTSIVLLASGVAAQTVTVTTTADVVDIDPFNGTVADLPGPDGVVSLSEAMIATNNTAGHQTVEFAIPAAQLGWFGPAYEGVAVFHSTVGFYWRANDEVTIDGTSQTAFAGDTNADGNEVQLYGHTFYVNDANSTVRGLHGTSLQVSGASCLVEGNTGGMNLTVFGGGGSVVRDNACGTIKIDRSNDNLVVGNTTQRVRVLGGGLAAPAAGNRIGGPNPEDRNFITGYGYVNSEGLPAGAAVQLAYTAGTRVENNSIGTTPDGLASGNAACTMGISFETRNDDVTVVDNRIAGILGIGQGPHHAGQLFGWAVYFWGSVSNVLLEGNTLGLDANGEPTLGSVWGVATDNFASYTYAGLTLAENEIAGHLLDGVRLSPPATLRLTRNAIHDNGGLGIDLLPQGFQGGVSPNDPLDLDLGANGVQNFPVLDAAWNQGGSVRVRGSLASSANDAFTVEFFASPACDGSGNGEGHTYLGATAIATDGFGDAAFDVTLTTAVPSGWVVTATATREPQGATSEFSVCVPTTDLVCQTDLGFGGPGAGLLTFCGGDLSSGTTAELRLEGAVPGQVAVLAIGSTFAPTPLFGGTVVPVPASALLVHGADASGVVSIPGLPGGNGPATLFAQFVHFDPSQAFGWAISNALQVEFLP